MMQMGRAADAIPHLEAARAIDSDGSIHFQLSRAYRDAGDEAKASAALKIYQAMQKSGAEAEIVITGPKR
jgi:predicted Zn-dependent protease